MRVWSEQKGRLPFQIVTRYERRTLPRPHARSREHRCTRPTQAIMAGSAKVDGNARAPRRGHTHDACAGSERRRPEVHTSFDLWRVHRPYRPPGDDSEAISALSACQGVRGLLRHHCHIAPATGGADTIRTRCRQRAHDVVVKSVGRAGDARARGRRRSDARGRLRAARAMAQPVGRRPTADRCRRGADRRTRFRFRVLLELNEM